jgi:hypothetical protein
MPVPRIYLGRPEQAGLVIDPQCLRREPGLVGEFADAEQLPVGPRRHAADDCPSPKGMVKRFLREALSVLRLPPLAELRGSGLTMPLGQAAGSAA